MDVCRERFPEFTDVGGGGRVACFLHTEGPRLEGRSLSGVAVGGAPA